MGTMNWVLFFIFVMYVPYHIYKIINGNIAERVLAGLFLAVQSCFIFLYIKYLLKS